MNNHISRIQIRELCKHRHRAILAIELGAYEEKYPLLTAHAHTHHETGFQSGYLHNI
jgi:hypothetical protein